MQKILFVSTRVEGRRAKYARRYFDEIEELSVKFMMSTHGVGRWPSSRTPVSYCEDATKLTEDEVENVDHVILMDEEPPCGLTYFNLREKYEDKIIHWKISEDAPWEKQKEEIQGKVIELIELVAKEIKIMYGRIREKIKSLDK
jgi:protein-tyrosine-phosphatase